MKKIGINGFGRIGRLVLRVIMEKYSDQLEVPIVNTSGKIDTAGWAYLFEFDTAYRRYKGKVEVDGDFMIVDDHKIMVTGEREPENIPWDEYNVETVIESTGVFRKAEQMQKHLRGSVNKVWLAAPAKGEGVETVVLGIILQLQVNNYYLMLLVPLIVFRQ
jgi:glyceraldehyde 3-phosphate dehydrogenase (phosphorylating)